jgi:aromatic ring hydroxylase
MSRVVKDFIEIADHSNLDQLIEALIAVRDSIPSPEEAEVKLRGDDIFGRRVSVSFYRPQTPEELECEARYADACRESRQKELSRLQQELGVVCHVPRPRRGGLRIVA